MSKYEKGKGQNFEGGLMKRFELEGLKTNVFMGLMLVALTGCSLVGITREDTVVRPVFTTYDRVAIWSRLPRAMEELFIPLYMEAFPEQDVVERRDLEALIEEQNLLPDRLDEKSRAKIRKLLGVKAIVFPHHSFNQVSVKVIDTETGEIVASALSSHTYFSRDRSNHLLIRRAIDSMKEKAGPIR